MEIISLNNNSCNVEVKKKLLNIISKVIEKNAWTQAHAAERLGVDQPKISQIKNGKTDGFSLERLLSFLKKFEHEITITITENQTIRSEHKTRP
ncbi:helix-turn-helix domain-containing protein [Wolbachia endosymbiont of Dipetalonema caudispina]|uniref:helix-turn-helix domain-containing protein n=1 Tax=Wolbachia endosymbiont of Dipetalonema caudispina TaxID=1812112 RepID=UPI00158EEE87|nr:helix-turn-helix transcriptional regulator [Wolbachia endosymbiont of Dipetalonema caudispina]MCV3769356.1 helix-turn-helix domain-containing protein [Wolbachia pipientis]QKX00894.1 helix-turn-helix domain-containing protein [Wolbachia endosymbiont of Dipetalonema caudispina]